MHVSSSPNSILEIALTDDKAYAPFLALLPEHTGEQARVLLAGGLEVDGESLTRVLAEYDWLVRYNTAWARLDDGGIEVDELLERDFPGMTTLRVIREHP
jgi:hypothetical protein